MLPCQAPEVIIIKSSQSRNDDGIIVPTSQMRRLRPRDEATYPVVTEATWPLRPLCHPASSGTQGRAPRAALAPPLTTSCLLTISEIPDCFLHVQFFDQQWTWIIFPLGLIHFYFCCKWLILLWRCLSFPTLIYVSSRGSVSHLWHVDNPSPPGRAVSAFNRWLCEGWWQLWALGEAVLS